MISALAKLIRLRLAELEISQAEACRRSGGLITQQLLSSMVTGKHRGTAIYEDTINGLSKALDVPVSKIQEVVFVRSGDPYMPPPESAYLSMGQRRLLDGIIRELVKDPE